jgi:sporulation protein YlmC with PRC-barrel domain
MRKFLIPAVSLAALSLSGLAFAQTTTTEQPTEAKPAVDCAANPADPACASSGAQTQNNDAATGTETGQSTTTTTDPATGTGTTTGQSTTGTDTTTGTAGSTTGTDTTTTTGQSTTTTTDPAVTTGSTTDPATTSTTDSSTTLKGVDKDFLASNFIGKTVYSSARENIGEINDMIVSRDGKVHQVVIGVGGFLGIGEKDVAVPMDQLSMITDENGAQMLSISSTRADLESAPAFDRTAMADLNSTGTATTGTGTTSTGTTNQ